MNIKPLFDKVVIESVTVEEKTKSGFFLPTAAQEKPQTCVVVAVGPGGIIDGKEIQMQVKVGDKVLCSKYAGSDFKVDGKELLTGKTGEVFVTRVFKVGKVDKKKEITIEASYRSPNRKELKNFEKGSKKKSKKSSSSKDK